MSLNFSQIPLTRELSASEKLMYNVVNTLAPLFLIGSSSFFNLAGLKDNHKVKKEFEIWPDQTSGCRVSSP